jgi:hypothetical protein
MTISLSLGVSQTSHLNQPGFHPTPICKRYGVGIPAELAKIKIIFVEDPEIKKLEVLRKIAEVSKSAYEKGEGFYVGVFERSPYGLTTKQNYFVSNGHLTDIETKSKNSTDEMIELTVLLKSYFFEHEVGIVDCSVSIDFKSGQIKVRKMVVVEETIDINEQVKALESHYAKEIRGMIF